MIDRRSALLGLIIPVSMVLAVLIWATGEFIKKWKDPRSDDYPMGGTD